MTKHQKATMGLNLEGTTLKLNLRLPIFDQKPACCAPGVIDPDIFLGEKRVDIAQAKAVCASCPVIDQCLSYALQFNSTSIWGGYTAKERLKLRRELADAPQMVDAEAVENLRLLRSSMSSKTLAKHFNVSERTIQRWRKEAGITEEITMSMSVVA